MNPADKSINHAQRHSVEADVLNEARKLGAVLKHLSSRNVVFVKDASRLTGISGYTLRKWCVKRDIGYWLGNQWLIDLEKLQQLLRRRKCSQNVATDNKQTTA